MYRIISSIPLSSCAFKFEMSVSMISGAAERPNDQSFWIWYMMRFFPGWPNNQSSCDYCFSLFLVFLLAFTAEFCSIYLIMIRQKKNSYLKSLLNNAGLHGLRMFMTYLLIVSIITTDFVYFLVAVAGHTAGNFTTKLYEYHNVQLQLQLQHGLEI